MFPANGSLLMTPPFPRSGPGESGSPMSQVVLRCYDFPSRILGHLFVSLPRPTLPSSIRVSQLALALPEGQRVPSGPGRCSTGDPIAGLLSRGRERDLPGSQAIRSVPLPRSRTPAEPATPCLLRLRRCCPRSLHSEGFSVMEISGLPRGFGTCCLRFTSDVATAHARLAPGWLASLYRKGVEPFGSLQEVSDHILVLLFWIYPGARRAFVQSHPLYGCSLSIAATWAALIPLSHIFVRHAKSFFLSTIGNCVPS